MIFRPSLLPALNGSRLFSAFLLAASLCRAETTEDSSPLEILKHFSSAATATIPDDIAALGAPQAKTRRMAQRRLSQHPGLTSTWLAAAVRNDDPEISQRAEVLLQAPATANDLRLAEALSVIAAKRIPLPLEQVADLLPVCDGNPRLATLWRRVFLASCTPNAAGTIHSLLSSPSPLARETALLATGQPDFPNAETLQIRALTDPEEAVRLTAITLRLHAGDPRALTPAVDLLESPTPHIRSQAHAALRASTGRSATYLLDDNPQTRAQAVADWRQWLAASEGMPPLRIHSIPRGPLPLATPDDLAQWIARTPDTRGAWNISEGILHCDGRGNGVLISPIPLSNYHLTYEWRWTDKPGDSGLFLGIESPQADSLQAIEVQMFHESAGDFWRIGYFTGDDGRPLIPNHLARTAAPPPAPPNGWNLMEIILQNGHLDVFINGARVNALDGMPTRPTHFGIQLERSPFQIRNLRADPLP